MAEFDATGAVVRRFSSDDPNDPPINDSRIGLQVGEGLIFRLRTQRRPRK